MSSITDESSEKGKNHSKSDYFYIRLFSSLLKYKINYFLDTYLRTYGLIYRLIPAFTLLYVFFAIYHDCDNKIFEILEVNYSCTFVTKNF